MEKKCNVEITGLASIINSVKNELKKAHDSFVETSSEPKMLLRRMQIEISLCANEKLSSDGKIDLKIVSVGLGQNNSNDAIHKVTLDFDIKEEFKKGSSTMYNIENN